MASPLRFGLELEMHGIRLTFRERGTNNYWAPAVAPMVQEDTMIALESILIPSDGGAGYLNPLPPNNVIWESDWGFRAVGDAFGTTLITPAGQPARLAGYCILELATAANRVDDHGYWTSSRLCAKQFVAAMDDYRLNNIADPTAIQDGPIRWYPLQMFLNWYNQKVQNLPPRPGFVPNRFKLTKSASILSLEGGTHASSPGHQWDAFITCSNDPINRWCDVQVNYQMSLRTLDTNLDAWIATWDSVWATTTANGPLDQNVGDNKNVPFADLYKTQIYAAMWRLARNHAHQYFAPPGNVGTSTPLVYALITYVLVANSITIAGAGNASSKNSFPQLPKTSPASIARVIEGLAPNAIPFFQQLAVAGGPDVLRARTSSFQFLRNKAQLMLAPGNLPQTAPQPTLPLFAVEDYGMLAAPVPPNFMNTWYGAFDNANALVAGSPPAVPLGNKMGFVTAAPFYCMWASEVNSSLPAAVFLATEIKMLFESRYGRNKLNIGFNPYIQDCLFNRSYMSLVRLLADPAQALAAQAAINVTFPDNPAIQQNFANGPH